MTQSDEHDSDFHDGFVGVSSADLEAMGGAELAEWQSGWKVGTAKNILAEREWQRRLTLNLLQEQYKFDKRLADAAERSNRFTMLCVVAATLVGAIIGAGATLVAGSVQQPQAPNVSPASTGSKAALPR